MAAFGRFVLSTDSRTFLSTRNCLLKISQNIRQNAGEPTEQVTLPPKPKRPPPSFLLYIKSIRPKLLETSPDMKVSEIIQKASKEWNNLEPGVKEDFKNQYNQSYEQYLADLKQYKESLTDKQILLLEEQKRKNKEREITTNNKRKMDLFQKPKRPRNAYLLFLESKRKIDTPRENLKNWVSEATKVWNKLPSGEKENYFNEATMLMKQYKEDLVKWEESMVKLGHPDIIRRGTQHKISHTKEEQQS